MKIGLLPTAMFEIAIATYFGVPPEISLLIAALIIGVGTAAVLRSYRPLKVTGVAVVATVAQWATASLGPPPASLPHWLFGPVLPMGLCCLAMLACVVMVFVPPFEA